MFRSIAVAAFAVAAVSVASANEVMLPTVDACNKAVVELEKVAAISGRPGKEVAEGREAIVGLKDACEKGDLKVASAKATAARQSLAQEN
jgi:hypothetical protein